MDVLGDVLLTTRLLASAAGILDLAAPWGIRHRHNPSNVAFGLTVLEGPCCFESASYPVTELGPGDSLVILRGNGYRLISAPGAPSIDFEDFLSTQGIPPLTLDRPQASPPVVTVGTGEVRTRLLVFALIAEDAGPSSIIANLPPTLLIRATREGLSPWAGMAADFFANDSQARPGFVATATRLVELLFTELVREHVLAAPEIDAGWMRGLRDPAIGRAIACIHSRPGERWTVDLLAREAGMGRSTFARRFAHLLGMSPIDYLIDHRMNLAGAQLSLERRSVGAVAEGLGYRSERAFRRAFRDRFGLAPSRYLRAMTSADEVQRTAPGQYSSPRAAPPSVPD